MNTTLHSTTGDCGVPFSLVVLNPGTLGSEMQKQLLKVIITLLPKLKLSCATSTFLSHVLVFEKIHGKDFT